MVAIGLRQLPLAISTVRRGLVDDCSGRWTLLVLCRTVLPSAVEIDRSTVAGSCSCNESTRLATTVPLAGSYDFASAGGDLKPPQTKVSLRVDQSRSVAAPLIESSVPVDGRVESTGRPNECACSCDPTKRDHDSLCRLLSVRRAQRGGVAVVAHCDPPCGDRAETKSSPAPRIHGGVEERSRPVQALIASQLWSYICPSLMRHSKQF